LPGPDARHPGDGRLLEPAAENAATAERAQRRAVVPFYRAWVLAQRALRSRRPQRMAAGICLTCSPARVLDELASVRGTAPYAWSTVSCMVSSFRFGGGMGSRPRRAHSRLGGAAVVTGSGEVAPKLRGLSGPRRITPLSTDERAPFGTGGSDLGCGIGFRGDVALGQRHSSSRPVGTGKSAGL
jgi:hypothetical protein